MNFHQAALISIIYLIIDVMYLYLIKDRAYDMVTGIQKQPLKLNLLYAFLAYVVLLISILYIGIPFMMANIQNKKHSNIYHSATTMGILGLCIYAVFAFTNMALFDNYWLSMVVADCLWGITVYTLIGYIYLTFIAK